MKYRKWQLGTIIIGGGLLLLVAVIFLLNLDQSINIHGSETRDGYVEALKQREIVKIIEDNGLSLKKSNAIDSKDYIYNHIKPETYELVEDYSYLLVYVFDTIEERELIDAMDWPNYDEGTNYFSLPMIARNAILVQLIQYQEEMDEAYFESVEIKKQLEEIVFYNIHDGKEFIYEGESEHWSGAIKIKTYGYFWVDADGGIQYEGFTKRSPYIKYKLGDIDTVKDIEYSFGGGGGSNERLKKDGTLDTGWGGINTTYYPREKSAPLEINWNDGKEVLNLELLELE